MGNQTTYMESEQAREETCKYKILIIGEYGRKRERSLCMVLNTSASYKLFLK